MKTPKEKALKYLNENARVQHYHGDTHFFSIESIKKAIDIAISETVDGIIKDFEGLGVIITCDKEDYQKLKQKWQIKK